MKVTELILNTNSLESQKDFYVDVLGLDIIAYENSKISFRVGSSVLSFIPEKPAGVYHFAFNIPPYQEKEALKWLKKRVKVLPFETDEIIDFSSWNARAIYFYDADKNIVEFISRRDLKHEKGKKFSAKSLMNISEVGIASTDIGTIYSTLNNQKKLPVYDGSFREFCAAGNEEGLFILVNKNEKKWFPTDDEIFISDLKVVGDFNFEYKSGKIIKSL
ncbi:VOC family protein [Galbibacter sp. EGI 63066]|uniref:VOC family protein n=1 Tax=Galbibacter sp. EGI 63066 TaxID=2993559 RepID=UPI002249923E|nr:VOC family protein [Galbibacter sp. EGI 63066]MCX2679684.1 VOC family protein [Galbibacter sp. EGI 63066]